MKRKYSTYKNFDINYCLVPAAQRLLYFAHLPTISQQRIACALRVSFISVEELQSIRR